VQHEKPSGTTLASGQFHRWRFDRPLDRCPDLDAHGGQCDSVGDAHPGWLCIALVLGVALQAAAIAKSPREIVLPLIGITAAERRTRLARSI